MRNAVRRALREAGLVEAGGDNAWGFEATPGSTPGVVRLTYLRGTNYATKESSLRYGNDQISAYVRVLQATGYKVSRVNGVGSVDRLLVMQP
jgi:hypothetical protein